MKSRPPVFLLACLFACGLAAIALPASAERVSSERSKAASAASAPPRWRAVGLPSKLVSRLQYREMPVARILKVEKYNAARRMKPAQIGINRLASSEGVADSLPALKWIVLKDGSSVARIELRSPVALALRVGLQVDALDPRAELRFAGSSDPSRVVAVINGKEILQLTDRNRIFWTPSTDGETQSIEVYLPAGAPRGGVRLQAPQLSHLLANSLNDFKMIEKIGESGSCNVDTACRVAELGANFVSAKNAVAHMQYVIAGEGTFICTGTLLADTVSTSQIPYFYSANHCIDNQTVASTLNTFWKYEATSCGSGVAGATVQLSGGAAILYSNEAQFDEQDNYLDGTDGLLLRLNNAPPAGSVFAGWDSTTLASSNSIYGIHHPSGDTKKVSSGTTRTGFSGLHNVGWLSGTTEGGSSGSGLFTAGATSYHLRGGLYGGFASCANTGMSSDDGNVDYYSRFDVVFPHIQQYLSPSVSNAPPAANFGIAVQGLTVTFTDASTDSDGTIVSRSWNFGDGGSSTAVNPVRTYAAAGTYSVTLTVTDDDGAPGSITRSVTVQNSVKEFSDFNGDGKSDLLWRNGVSGSNSMWRSANSTLTQAVRAVTDLAWRVAGVGDFNGDGKADLLWHHSNTGASALWFSANSATVQNLTTVTNLAWKIVGVGDFDGDGKADILWRNTTTGANAYWRSGNYATQVTLRAVTDMAWRVAGVGDFNGDGKADLLWHHSNTGASALWFSANSATVQNLTTITNLAWKIAGVGDFDGDGKADILWRNGTTGANSCWRSGNYATQLSVREITDTGWKVAAVGDYNGDGKADVVWRHSSTGANAVWHSANRTTAQNLTTVTDQNWKIMPLASP